MPGEEVDSGKHQQPHESDPATSAGLTNADKRQRLMQIFEKLLDTMFDEEDGSQQGGPGTTGTVGSQPTTGNTGSTDTGGGTIHIAGSKGVGIRVTDNGSISGRVVDAGGVPVPGVSVAISESPQTHNDIAAFTNADGRFRLSGLAPGPYKLAAHRSGSPAGEVQVVVAPGQQSDVEISIDG